MAGAGGMLPSLALLGGVSHGLGSMVGGAREQAQVEQVLGQHQFMNPAGRGGQGFTRAQARSVGDMMRQMQALPEMMTSMGELTRIMDKMGQMQVMQGVTDVNEFKQKFKSTIKTLKDMSKVLGSTMEEALPMFGEIRRSGIYSASDILKNAMSRRIVGGVTGMTAGQVGGLAQAGAQVSAAYGGSRGLGAQQSLRVAGQLGMAKQMGVLNEETILEMTGLEGGEGIQALSHELTQASHRMARGGLGTALTLALGEKEEGRFTGRMDEEMMERFRAGNIGRNEIMRMARRKSAGRQAAMSYTAHKKLLRANMASSLGVSGQYQVLRNILGERGFTNPDAVRIVGQRFGLSERMSDLLAEVGGRFPEMQTELRQQGRAEARRAAQEAAYKGQYSFDAVKRKLGTRIRGALTDPFKKLGVGIRDAVSGAVEDFVDDITGKYTVEMTRGVSRMVRDAATGAGTARSRALSVLTGEGAGAITAGTNMVPGRLGRAANWLTGSQSAGERIAGDMRLLGAGGGGGLVSGAGEQQEVLDLMMGGGGFGMGGIRAAREAGYTSLTGTDLLRRGGQATAAAEFRAMGRGETTAQMGAARAGLAPGQLQAMREELRQVRSFGKDLSGLSGADRVRAWSMQMAGRGGAYAEAARGAVAQRMGGRMMGRAFGAGETGEAQLLALAAGGKGDMTVGEARALTEAGGGLDFTISGLKTAGKKAAAAEEEIRARMGGDADKLLSMFGEGMGGEGFEFLERLATTGGRGFGMGEARMIRDEKTWEAVEAYRKEGKDFGEMTVNNLDEFLREQVRSTGPRSKATKAIIEANQDRFEALKGKHVLTTAIEKGERGETDFTPEQVEWLDKMGIDSGKFGAKEAGELRESLATLDKTMQDPSLRKAIGEWAKGKKVSGVGLFIERTAGEAKETLSNVRSLQRKGKLSRGLSERLGRIAELAEEVGAVTAGGAPKEIGAMMFGGEGGEESYAQQLSAEVYGLTRGLRGKELTKARGALMTDPALRAIMERQQGILGKREGRATWKDVFGATEEEMEERLGAEAVEKRKEYFEVGRGGKLTLARKEELAKMVGAETAAGVAAAAGVETRAQYADPAVIAKAMEQFSKNSTALADHVGTIAELLGKK
jgi:hypothetical protein